MISESKPLSDAWETLLEKESPVSRLPIVPAMAPIIGVTMPVKMPFTMPLRPGISLVVSSSVSGSSRSRPGPLRVRAAPAVPNSRTHGNIGANEPLGSGMQRDGAFTGGCGTAPGLVPALSLPNVRCSSMPASWPARSAPSASGAEPSRRGHVLRLAGGKAMPRSSTAPPVASWKPPTGSQCCSSRARKSILQLAMSETRTPEPRPAARSPRKRKPSNWEREVGASRFGALGPHVGASAADAAVGAGRWPRTRGARRFRPAGTR